MFATCAAGAEPFLKEELNHTRPDLRLAFNTEGFLTFKCDEHPHARPLQSAFARASGHCVGPFNAFLLARLPTARGVGLAFWGSEITADERDEWTSVVTLERPCVPLESLQPGDVVIDVVKAGDGSLWLGWHSCDVQDILHWRRRERTPLEAHPPSRAAMKTEEALEVAGVDLLPADVALEIGCAPGGSASVLLRHGLSVIGIDPASMHPNVLAHPKFRWIENSISRIKDADLPEAIDWLFIDMNTSAAQTMKVARRIASRHPLKGCFLTLKLRNAGVVRSFPGWISSMRAMGFSVVAMRQLPSHRQEVLLFALNTALWPRSNSPRHPT